MPILGNKIAQAIEEDMKYLRKSIHQIEAGRYQIHELTEADELKIIHYILFSAVHIIINKIPAYF